MADLLWAPNKPTRFASDELPAVTGRIEVERKRSRPFHEVMAAWITPFVFASSGVCLALAGVAVGALMVMGSLIYGTVAWTRYRRTTFLAGRMKCEIVYSGDSILLMYCEQVTPTALVWGVEAFGKHATSTYFPAEELDAWVNTYTDPLTAVLVVAEIRAFLQGVGEETDR